MIRENLQIPPSMHGYVNLVKEKDPVKGITRNTRQFRKLLNDIPKKKADYAYAPGKWTLKEMLQHIIDAERVFAFRALHIARKDVNPLPGFDENMWADNSLAGKRKWKDLVNEFFVVRNANERLFAALDQQQLLHVGIANNSQVSVATLAFVTAGHLEHHMNIIRERYLQPYPAAVKKEKEKPEKKKKDKPAKAAKAPKADKKKSSKKADKKAEKPVKKSAAAKKTAKKSKPQAGALKKDIGFAGPGKTTKKKK